MSARDDLAELGRKLAGRLLRLEADADRAGQWRQGIVASTATGPRRVTVELDDGTVPDVPLLDHHIMPSVSNAVWIIRVRPGGWLYGGKQG